MTPETPCLQPPPAPVYVSSPHPDRSGWLIAFGILQVLGGLFFWLMAAFMLAMWPSMAKQQAATGRPEISIFPVLFMYGGLGTFWIVMGIASAMKKNWARLTLLVISWAWLGVGVLATIGFALFGSTTFQEAARQTPNADPNAWKVMLVVMVIFSTIFMVALPLVLIFFYSRPSVKATCTWMVAGYRPSSRPLLLNIMAGYYFFAAASTAFSLFTTPRMPVFGIVLPRMLTIAFFLLTAVIHAFGGWAFLKRVVAGWWVMVAYAVFSLLSAMVTFMLKSPLEVYREMEIPAKTLAQMQRDPAFLVAILTLSIALLAANLVALWWAKRYFGPAAPPPSFSESLPPLPESNPV
jgi:F0F1-type ATP synthase membrane subunit c/vacuolar-type H+-ATPase subunit K